MKVNSYLISLVLKLVGAILLISRILDYIFTLFPSQWEDINWQITLINTFVNQGMVPLIGICFIFIGWWIEDKDVQGKSSSGLRVGILVLSCILGLFYLILIPLHIGNVNQISNDLVDQISQQVAQQEAQLDGVLARLEAVSKDPEVLKQEIQQRNLVLQSGGQVQGQQFTPQQLQLIRNETEQLQQLLDLSDKPEQLKAKLEEVKTTRSSELAAREKEEIDRTKGAALQQSLTTVVSSLTLAIAYTVIGWFGFRAMITKP